MSFTTGTQTEALAANIANSTAFTGTSAAAVQMSSGAGLCLVGFWLPSYGVGKALLAKAHGVLSTTSGTNTLTFGISGNTTQGTYNSSAIFATNGGVAQSASVTNVPWELEVLITCTATGASGTFLADGIMKVYPTSSTLLAMRVSSSSANPNTAVTISTESSYYIEYFANWSASSNSLTIYNSAIFGIN